MRYLSIDIETTGLDPNTHDIIEFAAVLEDTETLKPIEELESFRALVVADNYTVSPFCAELHLNLFQEINQYKREIGDLNHYYKTRRPHTNVVLTIENLMPTFITWVREVLNNNLSKVTVASKNFNGFDAHFLQPLLDDYDGFVPFRFGHRVWDPATLFATDTDDSPPSTSTCAERADVGFIGKPHTALADARMVIQLLRAGWQLEE